MGKLGVWCGHNAHIMSEMYNFFFKYLCDGSDGKEFACNAGDPSSIPHWEDPLEKEMVTHSSILAWRIPWTDEPGRLQSMELQRVGHDRVTNPTPQLYLDYQKQY